MPVRSHLDALGFALLLLTVFSSRLSFAQITTGTVLGTIRDAEGVGAQTLLIVSSDLGFHAKVNTNAQGTFLLNLPYGHYELSVQDQRVSGSSALSIDVKPLQNQEILSPASWALSCCASAVRIHPSRRRLRGPTPMNSISALKSDRPVRWICA